MTIEESFRRYPYYIYPAIEGLREAEGEERQTLLRRIAAGVGPMSALRTVLGVDPEEFRDFYGETEKPALTTEDTIDRFMGEFGGAATAAPAETEEVPVAPPAIDYAAMMLDNGADDAPMPQDDTSDLLNSFLDKPDKTEEPASQEEPTAQEELEQAAPAETPELSFALVKIMIEKRNYSKALEIITEINLKNPKKSIYFADQMRFLRKLMELEDKSKEQKI